MPEKNQQSMFVTESQPQTYTFEQEPIRGYPELRWAGKRPFRSTQYYPAQLKETHGSEVDGWRNRIYWGDNLQVMSHLLKEFRGKVDLVYIDPPFDSKADYKKKIELRGRQVASDSTNFEEKQYTDIWSNDEYLQFMYERLTLVNALLTEDGIVCVHVDPGIGHRIRMVMDEIFGPNRFINEIVWRYGKMSNASKRFPQNHDVILTYTKSDNYTFNPIKEADSEYKNRFIRFVSNNKVYFGAVKHSDDKLILGRVKKITKEMGRSLKDDDVLFDFDKEFKTQDDVFYDISIIKGNAAEKQDYPTQKPEALVSRIIGAFSRPDDLVLDCFMGSGTTQAAAMKSGRRFIGADINLGAIQTTTHRLLSIVKDMNSTQQNLLSKGGGGAKFTSFNVYNINHYDVFRNPAQARELLLEALEIEPLKNSPTFDGQKDGRVYKLMPVNRIATRQDLNELLTNLPRKVYSQRLIEYPNKPVEKITLVCMGHEPGLHAYLQKTADYPLDVDVLDILRDKTDLLFKREAEAQLVVENGNLLIKSFYPMNLLQKLSVMKEDIKDWRELVDSVMVDFNYDGAVLQPQIVDVPEDETLVTGSYIIPADAGTIRVKITDLLSESWEGEVYVG